MKATKVKRDGEKINKIACQYSDNKSAHFEMIYSDEDGAFLSMGGRVDVIGGKIAEMMARLIASGAVNENFIDDVAEFAKQMLKSEGEVQ